MKLRNYKIDVVLVCIRNSAVKSLWNSISWERPESTRALHTFYDRWSTWKVRVRVIGAECQAEFRRNSLDPQDQQRLFNSLPKLCRTYAGLTDTASVDISWLPLKRYVSQAMTREIASTRKAPNTDAPSVDAIFWINKLGSWKVESGIWNAANSSGMLLCLSSTYQRVWVCGVWEFPYDVIDFCHERTKGCSWMVQLLIEFLLGDDRVTTRTLRRLATVEVYITPTG